MQHRSKLNVVVFLADDLGYGDIGCHGNQVVHTPHMDQLALDSIELDRFYGPQRPTQRGFDEVLTFEGPAMFADQYFDPVLLHNDRPEKWPGYCMDVFTDAAIDFTRRHRAEPFFLYLHDLEPRPQSRHDPTPRTRILCHRPW